MRLSQAMSSTVGSIRDSALESDLPVAWHSYACCAVGPAFVHSRISTVNGCPDKSGRLWKPIQPQHPLLMHVVTVAHRFHEVHMLPHGWAEKTSEPRRRPNRVERRAEVRIQQCP